MYKRINSNRFPKYTALLLGLILSSVSAVAQPAFAANIGGSTQTYNYSSISHELKSTGLGKPQTLRTTSAVTYTIGAAANTMTDSFNIASGAVQNTNSYRMDQTNGMTKKHWDSNGNILSYNYNDNGIKNIYYYKSKPGSHGNITGIKSSFNITYTHNAFGEVTAIARGNKQDKNQGFSTFNIYGANGRLDEIIIGSGSLSTPSTLDIKESWTYHYGAGGNLMSVEIYSNTAKAHGSITYQYNYDVQNQLTKFITSNASIVSKNKDMLNPADVFGNAIKERSYHYGLNSNLNNVITTYTEQLNNAKSQVIYHYNTKTGEPNQLHWLSTSLLKSAGNTQATANFNTEIQAEIKLNLLGYIYTPYGAISKDPQGDTYQYNDLNQMITRATPLGSYQDYAYGTNTLLSYEKSYLYNKTKRINGKPVYFFYAGGVQPQEQEQIVSPGQAINNFYLSGLATFTTTSLRAKRGNLTHARASSSRGAASGSSVNVTSLYEVAQGNVAITIQNKANNLTIDNQYLYTPYGQQKDLSAKQYKKFPKLGATRYANLISLRRKILDLGKTRFGYTGQAKDPSSGLMMLGNFRNYAPSVGRFIQPDTYNSFIGVNSPYAYVKANPVGAVDPNGHMDDYHNYLVNNTKEMGSDDIEMTEMDTEETKKKKIEMLSRLGVAYRIATFTGRPLDLVQVHPNITDALLTALRGGRSVSKIPHGDVRNAAHAMHFYDAADALTREVAETDPHAVRRARRRTDEALRPAMRTLATPAALRPHPDSASLRRHIRTIVPGWRARPRDELVPWMLWVATTLRDTGESVSRIGLSKDREWRYPPLADPAAST